MPLLLKKYLIVTGVLAILALAVPDLVIIGAILLVLPGLILANAPTAFLWGCVYATALWVTVKWLDKKRAIFVAFLLAAAVLLLIPTPSILVAKERLKQYRLEDVAADTPIRPQGDIRIDTDFPRWDNNNRERLGFRPYSCENRCLALLFEPGVRSVTVTKTNAPTFEDIRDGKSRLDKFARTYRLLPRTQCSDGGLVPDLSSKKGYFGKTHTDNEAIADEWSHKLATDVCLVGEVAIDHYDMLIRVGRWHSETPFPSLWSLPMGRMWSNYGEIRGTENTVLFRSFDLQVFSLHRPLSINFFSPEKGFGWLLKGSKMKSPDDWDATEKDTDAALDVQRTAIAR